MGKLIIVSALLPVFIEKKGKEYLAKVSPGGLITALKQSYEKRKALWIGWHGSDFYSEKIKEIVQKAGKSEGFNLFPVPLKKEERENFFNGFSNKIIWPLFHGFPQFCEFENEYFQAYRSVNQKFAKEILKVVRKDDFIWIHDYHFFLLPKYLKQKNKNLNIGFFLHIPFPSPELFFRIPWRIELLEAFLNYDTIGFHTNIDRKNFLDCIDELIPEIDIKREEPVCTIDFKGRKIKVGIFPISIEFEKYNSTAKKVDKKIKELKDVFKDKKLIFCADRIDYTKGLIEKVKIYKRFLEKYPQFKNKVVFVEAVSKNIKKAKEYDELKKEFEHKISEINGVFGDKDYQPFIYLQKRLDFEDLISYYRYADVCLITPIRDGLNIVSKEYIASNIDKKGVLILSEFAGASTELFKHSFLINPYDTEKNADILYQALNLNKKERKNKMENLRRHVKKYDITWWVDTFLKVATGKGIEIYPKLEEDIPLHELINNPQ